MPAPQVDGGAGESNPVKSCSKQHRCMAALAAFSAPPSADGGGTTELRRALAGADGPAALQAAGAQARPGADSLATVYAASAVTYAQGHPAPEPGLQSCCLRRTQAPQWARGAGGRDTRAAVRSALQGPGGVGLNASQAAAVEAALGRTLTLWQVRRRSVRAHAYIYALTCRIRCTYAYMHACLRCVCACRVVLLLGCLRARMRWAACGP